eukprot:TRINITY_DN12512_c0_g1_i1.p1 TRINITY_DN12512_c0_g1~~TRINITY_DN12512_c0_g1_i1.p1  ORF type:complete len:282 (-),score=59.93 TRINITY_DN12512_c0_g1_i1:77-847(-)
MLRSLVGSEMCIRDRCWVRPDGGLRHFYRVASGDVHEERSRVGHVFVLFLPCQATTLQEIPAEAMVCAFSPLQAGPEAEHHEVLVDPEGEVHARAMPVPEREYRIIVRSPNQNEALLPPTDWTVEYGFICPAHPASTGLPWNPRAHTFYVWGDLSFDQYRAGEKFGIHRCRMNQIVPQVMTGKCLDQHTDGYHPAWHVHRQWVMQAQYYWQDSAGESRALCGEVIPVCAGDEIRSVIQFDATSGTIGVQILSLIHI